MRRKQTLLLLAAVAALLCGGIYTVASRRHVASMAATPLSPEDQLVAVHKERVAAQPDDAESHRMLASVLVKRAENNGNATDYDLAWQQLEQAEKFDPGSLRLLQARVVVSMSRHRFGLAQSLAEQGLSVDPRNNDFLGLAGDGALESGNLDAADRYYRQLAEVAPRAPSSWTRLAHLAEVRGDLAKAAELVEKSIEASYPKPLSHYGYAWTRAIKGEIEAKRGNLNEAERQYKWALAKYPDHPLALEFMAELQQYRGKNDEAEAIYVKLLTQRPDPKFQISLATVLEKRGAQAEAVPLRAAARRYYEQAVASGNEGYLRPLAMLELSSGNYKSAAELAARDLQLRPMPESRALYTRILQAAEEAGQPLTGFAPLAPRSLPTAQSLPVAVSGK